MTQTSLRRDSRSRGESLIARVAWGLGIGTLGQAAAGILIFVVSLVGRAVFDWSSSVGDMAIAGISVAGVAVGLALVATRPVVKVASFGGRLALAVLVSALAIPIVLAAGIGAAAETSLATIAAVAVVRTAVGAYAAVHDLFVGGLGIGRPWWRSPWAGVTLALITLVWLVPLIPRLSFESIPLLGLLGLWLIILMGLAIGAFRFYNIDSDSLGGAGWRYLAAVAGVTGLVLAVAVVVLAL